MNIKLLTDSRMLFDSVISLCVMAEKRLLLEIFELREAYRNDEISCSGWIDSKYNIADAFDISYEP